MLIDTHAHLFSPEFNDDLDGVIKRAVDAGIKNIVVPATDLTSSHQAIKLAEQYDMIYACVGFHPHDALKSSAEALHEIEEISKHPKVVAIGEIGLDYYYDYSPREKQIEVFREQLHIAVRRNLPVVIHTRDSLEDTIQIVNSIVASEPGWRNQMAVSQNNFPVPKGVFHCFSGDGKTALELIKKGFLISFPGIVTFKNSNAQEVLEKIGYDHVLLETDSPYLTPVPHRGKRNEPSFLPLIAGKIAQIVHASVDDIARTTSYNTTKLFEIGKMPEPVITYKLGNSLYINLTIRCNADCVFCDRKGEATVKGHNLKIEREPSAEEVIREIGDPKRFDQIVFCGYGEPTIRLETLKEVARYVKQQGGSVRLNTDGHGNIINKRNIVPELSGLVDAVSISLNSTDPDQYGRLMGLDGPRFHSAMIEFARESKKYIPEVVMTIVGMDEVDQEQAKEFVEKEIGVKYRLRPYF